MPKHSRAPAGHETLVRLVGNLYQTALEPERWPEALAALAADVGGRAVWFAAGDPHHQSFARFFTPGAHPEAIARLCTRFLAVEHNPWLQAGLGGVPGQIRVTDSLLPRPALKRTEFHADLLAPFGLEEVMGTMVLAEPELSAFFTTYRPRRPFTPEEQERLRAYLPHLRRAVQLDGRLRLEQERGRAALEALEQLQVGVVLVDERGRVRFRNRSAEELLAEDDGLRVERQELVARQPRETAGLRRLVQTAVELGCGREAPAGGEVLVSRPSGLAPYVVLAAPLPGAGFRAGNKRAAAALFLADPARRPEPSAARLVRLYGLTPAESQVAIALLRGGGIGEVAAELEVSPTTARTHLARIFQKTGTRRQAELVRLLLAGPALLRAD